MMRKFAMLLVTLLCCAVTAPCPARALLETSVASFATYETVDTPLTSRDIYRFIDPEKATYANALEAGELYLFSAYAYQNCAKLETDSLPLYNNAFLDSIAPGMTSRITAKVTTTGTVEFSGDYSEALKGALRAKLGADASCTLIFSVAKDTEFTFPYGASGNTSTYYLAAGFDRYQFTYELYDVYLVRQEGWIGLATEQRSVHVVYPELHVPRKTVYSTVDNV